MQLISPMARPMTVGSAGRFARHISDILAISIGVLALNSWADTIPSAVPNQISGATAMVLTADRVFDGNVLHSNFSVLISEGKVRAIGPTAEVLQTGVSQCQLGDATILPGLIELRAHMLFQNVPGDTVLRHGITTARDLGGPLRPTVGGDGTLRMLTAGPILTAPGGYPIPVFGQSEHGHGHSHGHGETAIAVDSVERAREVVRHLSAGGASVVKIGLDPGGEPGAPWMTAHAASAPPPWPLLTLDIVKAIVDEAHRQGKQVVAHLGEARGAELAIAGGVDEWAHIPCTELPDELLRAAVDRNIRVITTIDALSQCSGIRKNAARLAQLGAQLLYGAEIAHDEIPWGIDAEELKLMMHFAAMSPTAVLQSATAKAGIALGLAPLGTLVPGAPADIIAVGGNPFDKFKLLEYPDLVISGGKQVVNRLCTGTARH